MHMPVVRYAVDMQFSVRSTVMKWLPLFVVIVGMGALMYVCIHQTIRAGMNEPQIQIVADAVDRLSSGGAPADVIPREDGSIDLRSSLAPFIGVYDESGQPVETNGVLGGELPKPPVGVFTSSLATGENRVTWQPEGSVRIALVVRPVPNTHGYYVASGRSIREGERLIDHVGDLITVGVAGLLFATLVLELFGAWLHSRRSIVRE